MIITTQKNVNSMRETTVIDATIRPGHMWVAGVCLKATVIASDGRTYEVSFNPNESAVARHLLNDQHYGDKRNHPKLV